MKKKPGFAAIVAIALALVGSACSRNESAPRAGGPVRVGARAPEFTLPSAAGGEVSLGAFAGKPVVLYFSMGPG